MSSGLVPVGFTITAEGAEKVKAILQDILAKAKEVEAGLSKTVKSEGEKRARERRKQTDDSTREEARKSREQEKEAKKREQTQEREFAKLARQADRWRKEEEAAQKRHNAKTEAEAKRNAEARRKAIQGIGSRIGGDLGKIGGVVGAVGGMVGALGGGFAVSDAVSQQVKAEALAKEIQINSGGEVKKGEVLATAHSVAKDQGFSTDDVLKGQKEFIGLAGDYKMGMSIAKEVAELANATGTTNEDLMKSAANIFNGDKSMKKDQLLELLRNSSAQGRVGAVDTDSLTAYQARIAAAAGSFGEQKDYAKNFSYMSSLAQVARQRGGASSTAEATETVASLYDDVKKHAGKFKGMGIDVQDKYGNMKNPEDIVKNLLVKTGGDPIKLNKLLGEQSSKAIAGFMKDFRTAREEALKAGKTEVEARQAGLDAYKKSLAEYGSATLSAVQATEESNQRKEELDKRAAMALENLRIQVGEKLVPKLTELMPTIEKLIPKFVDLLGSLIKLSAWVADNPFKSAFIGLGAIVAKAIVQEIVVAKLGEMLTDKLSALGSNAGGSAKELGSLGLAITAAAASVMAAKTVFDKVSGPEFGNNADDIVRKAVAGDADAERKVSEVEDQGLGIWGDVKRGFYGAVGTAEIGIGSILPNSLGGDYYTKRGNAFVEGAATSQHVAEQLKDASIIDRRLEQNHAATMRTQNAMLKELQKLSTSNASYPPQNFTPAPPSTSGRPPSTDGQH